MKKDKIFLPQMSEEEKSKAFYDPRKVGVASPSAERYNDVVESPDYAIAYQKLADRVIPAIDVRDPSTWCFYGSAEKYFKNAFNYITNFYPYDGSALEKIHWALSASAIDLAILQHEFPLEVGHVNFSKGGWGTAAATSGKYGLSSNPEYIKFSGGPYVGTVIDSDSGRESSLKLDPSAGNTVEFWLKKNSFISHSLTESEIIFDSHTTHASEGASSYGRFLIELSGSSAGSPFYVTYMSGTAGANRTNIGADITKETIADGAFHHYAVTAFHTGSNLEIELYIDGNFNNRVSVSTATFGAVEGYYNASIGAMRTQKDSNGGLGYGKLSGSIDEFRFWKTKRTAEEIGNYYDFPVNGATDQENINSLLGVYYKFNEGLRNDEIRDKIVLDSSGRINNGEIIGFSSTNSRTSESAITNATVTSQRELGDPIIDFASPRVVAAEEDLLKIGKAYDHNNHSSLFRSVPQWAFETNAGSSNIESDFSILLQSIGQQFDSIKMMIDGIPKIGFTQYKDFVYARGSSDYSGNSSFYNLLGCSKDFDVSYARMFGEENFSVQNLLGKGFGVTESPIVNKTDLNEYFYNLKFDIADPNTNISQNLIHSKAENIKNKILNSVHANIAYIFKQKGTKESFRNLIRCFGVDENLISPNIYGQNVEKVISNRPIYEAATVKSFAFTGSNNSVTLLQTASNSASDERNYIQGKSSQPSFTIEGKVLFPTILDHSKTAITSSVFGMNEVSGANLVITSDNYSGFVVRTIKSDILNSGCYFQLSSSKGTFPIIKTEYFNHVYENTPWYLAVRFTEDNLSQLTSSDGKTTREYKVDFIGYRYDIDVKTSEFHITSSISQANYEKIMSRNKSAFLGASRQNITGTVRNTSDCKFLSFSVWDDLLEKSEMEQHAQSIENLGRTNPLFRKKDNDGASRLRSDALVLNWQFDNVNKLNASTSYFYDFSSGSAENITKYGPITGYKYPAVTHNLQHQEGSIRQEYIPNVRYLNVDNLEAESKIEIKDREVDSFTLDSKPMSYLHTYEKSMYQVISKEMLNMLAGATAFNNLIGEPVYKYRQEYKTLEKLRDRFFARVENKIDLESFIEYYKWIDSSLANLLRQLQPATSNMNLNLEDVVESHVFERNKYKHQAPQFEYKDPKLVGQILGVNELLYDWEHGHAPLLTSSTSTQTAASGSIVYTGNPEDGDTLTIISTDGTSKTYEFNSAAGGGTVAGGNIAVSINGGNVDTTYANLVTAINGATGHNAGSSNSKIVLDHSAGTNTVTLTQATAGTAGNTTITAATRRQKKFFTLNTSAFSNRSQFISSSILVSDGGLSRTLTFTGNSTYPPSDDREIPIGTVPPNEVTTMRDRIIAAVNGTDGTNLQSLTASAGGTVRTVFFTGLHSAASISVDYDSGGGSNSLTNHLSAQLQDTTHQHTFSSASISAAFAGGTNTVVTTFQDHPKNCLWWQERAERDKVLSVSDNVNPDREQIRQRINTVVSSAAGSTYVLRRLSRPYNFVGDHLRTLDMGSNRNASKNKFLHKPIIASGGEITVNKSDIYEFKNCNDVIDPQHEDIYTAIANTAGTDGDLDADADMIFPFTLYSSSVGTDFSNFKDKLTLTNNHDDDYGVMQGVFTREFVGGMPHRRVKFGTADKDRPEAYILSASSTVFTMKQSTGPRSYTPRGMGVKGPVNIRNIKENTGISPIAMGNYREDYDIVQTSGRSLNNAYVKDSGSVVTTGTQLRAGIIDYTVPSRGTAKHVFVNRFSSPGGPETQGVYGRDKESEEYSVYNGLNYRNLSTRAVLNRLHKEKSLRGGQRSGGTYYTPASIIMFQPLEIGDTIAIDFGTGSPKELAVGAAASNFTSGGSNFDTTPDGYSLTGMQAEVIKTLFDHPNTALSAEGFRNHLSASVDHHGDSKASNFTTLSFHHRFNQGTTSGLASRDTWSIVLSVKNPGNFIVTQFGKAQQSVHVTNRNYSLGSSGGKASLVEKADNFFVQHPIPQNDFHYSWITASAVNTKSDFVSRNAGLGHQHTYTSASAKSIQFLSASEVVYYAYQNNMFYGLAREQSANPSQTRAIDFVGLNAAIYEPISSSTNTVGYGSLEITNVTGDMSRLSANYLNQFFMNGLAGEELINPPFHSGGEDKYAGEKSLLNSIIVHRQGPYGWPSWKQIRTGNHPIARAHRKTNTISRTFLAFPKRAITSPSYLVRSEVAPSMNIAASSHANIIDPYERARFLDSKPAYNASRVVKNYVDPVATGKFNPIRIILGSKRIPNRTLNKDEKFTLGRDPRDPREFVNSSRDKEFYPRLSQRQRELSWFGKLQYFKDLSMPIPEILKSAGTISTNTAPNDITSFANSDFIKDIQFKEKRTHGTFDYAYNLLDSYQVQQKMLEINYKETIYPREVNTYSQFARERTKFKYFPWNSDRDTRHLILSGNVTHDIFGAKLISITRPERATTRTAAGSIIGGSNAGTTLRLFPEFEDKKLKSPQNSFAGKDALLVLMQHTGSFNPHRGILHITSSTWPLDSRRDFGSTPVDIRVSFMTRDTIYLTSSTGKQGTRGEGILQNDYSTFPLGMNNLYGTPPHSVVYNRRVPQSYGNFIYLAGEAKWEAASGTLGPFYDSYSDYAAETRILGQDHSLVPEFRISEFVDDIVQSKREYPNIGDDFLILTGAVYLSSSNNVTAGGNFFKTYSNSDFLKYFQIYDEEVSGDRQDKENNLEHARINFRCQAVTKFLPYKGFYPAERTVQIAELFYENYLPDDVVVTNDNVIDISQLDEGGLSSTEQKRFIKLRANASRYQVTKPLFGPGILFNSIKAGLATDYPIFSGAFGGVYRGLPRNDGTDYGSIQNIHAAFSDVGQYHASNNDIMANYKGNSQIVFNTDFGSSVPWLMLNAEAEIGQTGDSSAGTSTHQVGGTHPLAQDGMDKKLILRDNTGSLKAPLPFTASVINLTNRGGLGGSSTVYGIPRLRGHVSKRIEFEEMLSPSSLFNVRIYDNEPHPSASLIYGNQQFNKIIERPALFGSFNTLAKKDIGSLFVNNEGSLTSQLAPYTLAMQNFAAETVNFFLKDGDLTTKVSKPGKQTFTSGNDYKMRIYLENVDTMMYDRHSAFGPPVAEAGSDGTGVAITKYQGNPVGIPAHIKLTMRHPSGSSNSNAGYTLTGSTAGHYTRNPRIFIQGPDDNIEIMLYHSASGFYSWVDDADNSIENYIERALQGLVTVPATSRANRFGVTSAQGTANLGTAVAFRNISGNQNFPYPTVANNFAAIRVQEDAGAGLKAPSAAEVMATIRTLLTSSVLGLGFSTSGTNKVHIDGSTLVISGSTNLDYKESTNISSTQAYLDNVMPSNAMTTLIGATSNVGVFVNCKGGSGTSTVSNDHGVAFFGSNAYGEKNSSHITSSYQGHIYSNATSDVFTPFQSTGSAGFTKTTTKVSNTHGYMPYVPSFLDANSAPYVEVTFSPTVTKDYTVREVMNSSSYAYYNFVEEASNADVPDPKTGTHSNTNYHHAMSLSASLNLGMIAALRTDNFDQIRGHGADGDGALNVVPLDPNNLRERWVIQTKWESPVLDFKSVKATAYDLANSTTVQVSGSPWKERQWDRYYDGVGAPREGTTPGSFLTGSTGMWHQKGQLLKESDKKGYYLSIIDVPIGANTPGLAARLGFNDQEEPSAANLKLAKKYRDKVGTVEDRKVVKEAIVAIPYVLREDLDNRVEFIKFNEDMYNKASDNVRNMKITKETDVLTDRILTLEDYNEFRATLDGRMKTPFNSGPLDAIEYQLFMMEEFILPPQFDFINVPENARVQDPFMMYFFQFHASFDAEDLSNIWQNLYPKSLNSSAIARKSNSNRALEGRLRSHNDISFVSHYLETANLTGENLSPVSEPRNLFSPDEENKTRWIVFKVKQRGIDNLETIRRRSIDPRSQNLERLEYLRASRPAVTKGTFPDALPGKTSTGKRLVHYNWPYDYFSFVELIKLEAKIDSYNYD